MAKQYVAKLQSSEEEIQRLRELLASQVEKEEMTQTTPDVRVNKNKSEKKKTNMDKEAFKQNTKENKNEKEVIKTNDTSNLKVAAKNSLAKKYSTNSNHHKQYD